MTCSLPPELDEIELMAYLEDAASDETRMHLAQCPHCRSRMKELNGLQTHLKRGLYRATCPTPVELGEYHLERLPAAAQQLIAGHLSDCPHCVRELDQLREYLQSLSADLQPSLLAEAQFVVGKLLGRDAWDDALVGAAPALAGVRGEGEPPRVYQAGELQVAIQSDDEPENPGRKSLLGVINSDALAGSRAYLWDAEELIAESTVSEANHFTFSDLAPGEYTLILSGPAEEIHLVVTVT